MSSLSFLLTKELSLPAATTHQPSADHLPETDQAEGPLGIQLSRAGKEEPRAEAKELVHSILAQLVPPSEIRVQPIVSVKEF